MKKTTLKKLTLARETLRRLTAEQAKLAVGEGDFAPDPIAAYPPLTTDSVRVCCA